MAEYIREVEKIIDAYHKQNPLFSLNRKTALGHDISGICLQTCFCLPLFRLLEDKSA